jgi:conjugal transfer pilus assembly protein TraI
MSAAAYPSVDQGIEPCSVEDLLAANEPFLGRIKLSYGVDRKTFEADLLDVIRRYAEFVNLLPATPDNFFAAPGGLFRLGLEIGFFALQGTDGHIVSGRSTITVRRELEPRWRQATFVAGLLSEVHRTLSRVVITDERGEEWPAYLQPLTSWLRQRGARRFFIRWVAGGQETRALALFALPQIVPAALMQHLATNNATVVPHLMGCVSGIVAHREPPVLTELVRRAAALVIDQDLLASSKRYGRPILGAHLERYLLDAMRTLVLTHCGWRPNQKGSRVWLAQDGLFLVWPGAATEIRKLLKDNQLAGIPNSPDTIVEILLGADVLERHPNGTGIWTISPPSTDRPLEAIRFAAAGILLSMHDEPPAPLPTTIAVTAAAAAPPASSPVAIAGEETAAPSDTPSRDKAPAPGEAQAVSAPDPAQGVSKPEPPAAAAAQAPAVGTHPVAPAAVAPQDSSLRPSPGPASTVVGDTLDLFSDAHRAAAAPDLDEAAPPRAAGAASPPAFRLKAPMRLSPQVRDVLAAAVQTLNGDPKEAVVVTVPAGLFVPLNCFSRRNIDGQIALRAVGDAGMTVASKSARRASPVQHEVDGKTELGFVLLPAFVDGFDPADFTPAA